MISCLICPLPQAPGPIEWRALQVATSDTNMEVAAGHGLKPRLPRATRVEEGSMDEPHSHGLNS